MLFLFSVATIESFHAIKMNINVVVDVIEPHLKFKQFFIIYLKTKYIQI